MSKAPTPTLSGKLVGEATTPQAGPALPLDHTGKMPAATQACTPSRKVVFAPLLSPQELFTMRAERRVRVLNRSDRWRQHELE